MNKTLANYLSAYRAQLHERITAVELLMEVEEELTVPVSAVGPGAPIRVVQPHVVRPRRKSRKKGSVQRRVTHRMGHRTSMTKTKDYFEKHPSAVLTPIRLAKLVSVTPVSASYALNKMWRSGYLKRTEVRGQYAKR